MRNRPNARDVSRRRRRGLKRSPEKNERETEELLLAAVAARRRKKERAKKHSREERRDENEAKKNQTRRLPAIFLLQIARDTRKGTRRKHKGPARSSTPNVPVENFFRWSRRLSFQREELKQNLSGKYLREEFYLVGPSDADRPLPLQVVSLKRQSARLSLLFVFTCCSVLWSHEKTHFIFSLQ